MMRVALSLMLAAGLAGSAGVTLAGPPTFTDQTRACGIKYKNLSGAPGAGKRWALETFGAGAAWLDYDNDGNFDLYLVNGSDFERGRSKGEPNRLYRGDGKGRFTDVTDKAAVGDKGWGFGVGVGDFDNDGHSDIYVANYGGNVLYRNKGDGTFENVTAKAGVAGHPDLWSTVALFFDMDADGDLDLYVGNYMDGDPERVPGRGDEDADCYYRGMVVYCGPLGQVPLPDVLYRNNGDGTFTDVTKKAGLFLELPRYTLGAVTADFDNDGDQDLYVANDSVQNSLYRNNGDGTFEDIGVRSLAALNTDGRAQAGMGTDAGDYDEDGWIDIVVTNFANDLNTLYRNMGGKFFIDDSMRAGMTVTNMVLSWGTGFYDFDLDGDRDLFTANGHVYPQVDDIEAGTSWNQRNHLFVNQDGKFSEVSASSGPGLKVERSFRGAAFGDYDNDGDVDVVVIAIDDEALLLRNDTPSPGHYLQVQLVGRKSNRDGVGARVTLVAGGRRWIDERMGGGSYLSSNDPRLHFGLGSAAKVDRVEVAWPSGTRDVLLDVAADRVIAITEGAHPAAKPAAESAD